MECKVGSMIPEEEQVDANNSSRMECKAKFIRKQIYKMSLIIVPEWNVKTIIKYFGNVNGKTNNSSRMECKG